MESLQDLDRESLLNPRIEPQSALIALNGLNGWAMCFSTPPAPAGAASEIPDNVAPALADLPAGNAPAAEHNGLIGLDGITDWAMCHNEPPLIDDVADVPMNEMVSVRLLEQTLPMGRSS